jgi:hypothetical protein
VQLTWVNNNAKCQDTGDQISEYCAVKTFGLRIAYENEESPSGILKFPHLIRMYKPRCRRHYASYRD